MAFDPLSGVLNLAGSVIDKIFPDKTEAEKAKVRMAELAMQGQLEELKIQADMLIKQMAINETEAKHASWFVAGWRPFVGWTCGIALAYHFVLQQFLAFVLSCFNVKFSLPFLDMGELMTILMGMLGLGAFRTYEKTKNGGKKNGEAD